MKRIFSLMMITLLSFTSFSCSSDDDVDNDTYSVVYELRNVNFEMVNGTFTISRTFNTPIYDSDMLLVYMQNGTTNNGAPIWQLLPITFYLNAGNEVDYNFDFSRFDFAIFAGGNFNLAGTSFVTNKTFRVLIIPAGFGQKAENQLDFQNYESVIDYYGINDTKVVRL